MSCWCRPTDDPSKLCRDPVEHRALLLHPLGLVIDAGHAMHPLAVVLDHGMIEALRDPRIIKAKMPTQRGGGISERSALRRMVATVVIAKNLNLVRDNLRNDYRALHLAG